MPSNLPTALHVATLSGLLALASTLVAGCKDDDRKVAAATTYRQVERIGRPAINEGLFTTNDFLNTVNSIAPSQDATSLVGAVLTEAAGVLNAVDGLDGTDHTNALTVVKSLIPDVLRIDTNIASPVGTAAYANGAILITADAGVTPAGSVARPVAGRKIEDDVIDITLSVLASGTGAPTVADGVSYTGQAGNEAQPGHKLLNGQTVANGAATFPFLAAPH
ncbi:MAG: DUF4331 family protein [Planctomycetes bacterium]|nr:DUF4331 family protein [Planctomycetota bacterium]